MHVRKRRQHYGTSLIDAILSLMSDFKAEQRISTMIFIATKLTYSPTFSASYITLSFPRSGALIRKRHVVRVKVLTAVLEDTADDNIVDFSIQRKVLLCAVLILVCLLSYTLFHCCYNINNTCAHALRCLRDQLRCEGFVT